MGLHLQFTAYGFAAPAGSKTAGVAKDGRRFVRESSRATGPWKRHVAESAARAMRGRPLATGPVAVAMTFHRPRPKSHFGRRGQVLPSAPWAPTTKPDVLKLARAVEDGMTGVVYRDDAQIVTEHLSKEYGEPARVEIRVIELGHR